jgi:HAD superfamily hydrolase (TIGR01509 family)
MKYRAIILDFDGLILDTESAHFQAWSEAYASYGLELPLERWAACVGTDWNAFNPYVDLESRVQGGLDRESFRSRKEGRARELILDLRPRDGIVELMEDARTRGWVLGLASSSDRPWVEGHLRRLDLLHYFKSVRTLNDVAKVKPDPELYVTCLRDLGVESESAVALEDSPNGIRAAKAAGLYTFAYPNPVTNRMDLSQADQVVAHPSECWRRMTEG